MNILETRIYKMDDVAWRFYMNLQADQVALSKIIIDIKHKTKLIKALYEIWLDYEKLELDEADNVYNQKYRLELELSQLEKDKRKIETRITSYACKKTRSP